MIAKKEVSAMTMQPIRPFLLVCFAVLLSFISIFLAFGVGLDKGVGKSDDYFFGFAFLFSWAAMFVSGVVGRDWPS
jgi:hypothetical protein